MKKLLEIKIYYTVNYTNNFEKILYYILYCYIIILLIIIIYININIVYTYNLYNIYNFILV